MSDLAGMKVTLLVMAVIIAVLALLFLSLARHVLFLAKKVTVLQTEHNVLRDRVDQAANDISAIMSLVVTGSERKKGER